MVFLFKFSSCYRICVNKVNLKTFINTTFDVFSFNLATWKKTWTVWEIEKIHDFIFIHKHNVKKHGRVGIGFNRDVRLFRLKFFSEFSPPSLSVLFMTSYINNSFQTLSTCWLQTIYQKKIFLTKREKSGDILTSGESSEKLNQSLLRHRL